MGILQRQKLGGREWHVPAFCQNTWNKKSSSDFSNPRGRWHRASPGSSRAKEQLGSSHTRPGPWSSVRGRGCLPQPCGTCPLQLLPLAQDPFQQSQPYHLFPLLQPRLHPGTPKWKETRATSPRALWRDLGADPTRSPLVTFQGNSPSTQLPAVLTQPCWALPCPC